MWWFFAGVDATAVSTCPSGLFLGRPRRFVPVPPRASIARSSLLRSSMSSASMCSVGISQDRNTRSRDLLGSAGGLCRHRPSYSKSLDPSELRRNWDGPFCEVPKEY